MVVGDGWLVVVSISSGGCAGLYGGNASLKKFQTTITIPPHHHHTTPHHHHTTSPPYHHTIPPCHTTVSIDNILVDIGELERGMEMTRRECHHRKDAPVIMKDFVTNSEEKIKKLKSDAKVTRVSGWVGKLLNRLIG